MSRSKHPSAISRLVEFLRLERADLVVLGVYAFTVALLTLAVPLAMQALVNTLSAGIFLQPVVVLTLLVLGGLLAAGLVQLLQYGLVERLQQRVFVRTALEIADRLARVRASALRRDYAPELANRFFDVLTVQKSLSKMLMDGLAALAQALVGVLVLGLFNPSFLLVAIGIVALFLTGQLLLGLGGLRTSLRESAAKYRVAGWIEEIARGHVGLKMHADPTCLLERTDVEALGYLEAREAHFRICRRQAGGFFLLAALANAGLLAVGGRLVLDGTLTLGQLVAAQIIVTLVLASLDKLTRHNEAFFDLLTGLEKTGHLTDLEKERLTGVPLPDRLSEAGARVVCRGVRFGYDPDRTVLDGVDLVLEPGDRACLVGGNGAGKSTLVALLCGLETPAGGTVEVDGTDVRSADLASLRRAVALVTDARELIHGTVRENIVLGRAHVTPVDVRWAAELAGLEELPDGLETPLLSGGINVSRGMAQRILIARAVVDRPRLLILDEGLSGIEERAGIAILERLLSRENGWTLLDVSHEPQVVVRASRIWVLSGGCLVANGPPKEIARNPEFAALFPYLSESLVPKAGKR